MAFSKLRNFTVPVRLPERDAEHEARFKDVEPEMLATDAATSDDDTETLPEFVRRAIVEQQAEVPENALAQNGAPQIDATEEENSAPVSSPEIEPIVEVDGQSREMIERRRQSVPPAEMLKGVARKDIKAFLKRVARIY